MSDLPQTDPEMGLVDDATWRLKPEAAATYVQDPKAPPDNEDDVGNRAHAEWARYVIESLAQTNAALFSAGSGGPPTLLNPSVAQLTGQSITTPDLFWRFNGSKEEEVAGDAASIVGPSYARFRYLDYQAGVPEPVTGIQATSSHINVTALATNAIKVETDMSFACFCRFSGDPDVEERYILDYGTQNNSSSTGARRVPYSLYLANGTGASTQVEDRCLTYEHYDAGDVAVTVKAEWNAFPVTGGSKAVCLQHGREYMVGITRTVTATTELNFYVDGRLVATHSGLANAGTPGTDSQMRLHYGSKHSAGQPLAGYVRSAGIWTSVITPAEMLAFYELGSGRVVP